MSLVPPRPPNEPRRLEALRDFHILDTPPDPRFDRLARLAARQLDVPIALVSLMDAERQWFKACLGLSVPGTSRDVAFCAYTILGTETMDVPDATADARFAANPLVTGAPGIRSYVGVPLTVEDGLSLGTLCLIDTKPRPPLSDHQRSMIADIAAAVVDLLRAHRAEWRARRNETLFRTALGAISEGFSIHDADGRLQFFNPQYRAFHPASGDRIVPGARMEETLRAAIDRGDFAPVRSNETGDDPAAALLAQRQAARSTPEAAVERRLADGRWLRIADYPTEDGGTVSILSDITEIKLYQRALEDAVAAAQEADRAKSRFLAMMSHEIRTPLNGVLGTLGLLADSELAADQRTLVETGRRSGDALLILLNDILDLSKIQAGKLTLEPTAFSLSATIADVLSLFDGQARDKGLALTASLGAEMPPAVWGDAGRVRQVLMNYVSNAVKFTDAGRVTVEAFRVAARDTPPDHAPIEIAVTDTGPGISQADQNRLFKEFSQLDGTQTRRFEGTGLGLVITRELAELMGGTVGVESAPRIGSRFWVRLPLPNAEGRPERGSPAPRTDARLRTAAGRRPRILLVEDNPANQMVTRSILERFDCAVDLAGNGAEAVTAVRARRFDAVLMDIAMPVMDGLTATRAILSQADAGSAPPIIAVTANAYAEDLATYRATGMCGHVSKPIVRRALLDALLETGLAIRNDATAAGSTTGPDGPAATADGDRPETGAGPALLDEPTLTETLADFTPDQQDRFLDVFTRDLEHQLTRLLVPNADDTLEAVGLIAHTLKSTCGTFGALPLADAVTAVENACRTGNRAALADHIATARSLGGRTVAAFRARRTVLAGGGPDRLDQTADAGR